ncbi:hypothetical protein FOA43_003292 [Brettanomyces nanus]|uniref:Cell wall mannoprotein PIR1-like C-terminal domain-containing protein n=1 Tax=Eeniella nana TaxID=13502 RepID=A0A875S3K1_EENNA|nr:uncharacterized protein FOA43_003292 [Brettanomyces nanus]QPG75906.1 hypothetical protein FOA43_003292 [Brettanomyces nanus]
MILNLGVALVLATSAIASYVPSEAWSTLTPDQTLSGATTDYDTTFGIVVNAISTSSSATTTAANQKRDVASQVGDGQVQATTSAKATASKVTVASQISDGQIQATSATKAGVVSQIGDGQIQATSATKAGVVSQIGDGQIQATTATKAGVVSQIGDGQIQATTKTTNGASQIGDGQVQATTGASEISDGQVEATGSADSTGVNLESCKSDGSLAMTLNAGILTDSKGRIGSIVANDQFQFDGPPPQAGAIYAAGWGISSEGNLAIGNTTTFYQCLSGTFYNLYDKSIGSQCHPVNLEVVDLVEC